ncbi:aspartyl protease family protein [Steroidobacter flavus]|uniref:Aspartyl protease family protein n=1 Tax=Steroidobacter flavus TaxID=1842136 RepID=A0ABV8T074_9GAMM
MAPRLFLFALVALAPLATLANDVDVPSAPPPPATADNKVEEVVVAAPEPRYVAPTLRDRIGRVWAPVYINGKGPYKLVLDTGANRTAVIPSLARKIGTNPGTNVLKVLGATGSSIVPAIKVDSIEVGDLFLGDRQVAIVPDVFGGAEGVLGADGLSDKRVHIDFKNDQISILRSTGPVRANGYTRIPVKLRYGHLLMFDVKLAGVRTRAMLDTGAQTTIGNSTLRAALAKRKRQGVENTIIGVTLDAQKGETVLAPSVELGDLTLRGMQVTFGDMYIFDAWKMTDQPALLIGMDIIGLLDTLIIDYKRRELHLRARG